MNNLRWVASLICCSLFGMGMGYVISNFEWVRWLMIVPTTGVIAVFAAVYINKLFGVE